MKRRRWTVLGSLFAHPSLIRTRARRGSATSAEVMKGIRLNRRGLLLPAGPSFRVAFNSTNQHTGNGGETKRLADSTGLTLDITTFRIC